MITHEDLVRRANERASAGKPKSIIGTILIGILVNLVAKYIYDNCIANRMLGVDTARNPGFFKRRRLRRIIREQATSDDVLRLAIQQRVVIPGTLDIYKEVGDDVERVCLETGATLTEGDLK